MINYVSTKKFIQICTKEENRRYNAFCKSVCLDKQITDHYRNDIEKILNFVKEIDIAYHKFDKYNVKKNRTVFGQIFHTFVASDLRAMIILSITEQQIQSNIILRHLIENLIYSLWADLISRFTLITEFLLYPEEWKPYRAIQKIVWNPDEKNYPQRSIRERLERIRLINFESKDGKQFYQKYFTKATMYDILILLSLPICHSCMQDPKIGGKVNCRKYHVSTILRKQGKEDKHAHYKTDFGYHCSFCKRQKLTQGYALGIPDFNDMIEMLAEALIYDDTISEKLRSINQVYSYLSSDFVHFSTEPLPGTKPQPFNSTSGKVILWGFEGIFFYKYHEASHELLL